MIMSLNEFFTRLSNQELKAMERLDESALRKRISVVQEKVNIQQEIDRENRRVFDRNEAIKVRV